MKTKLAAGILVCLAVILISPLFAQSGNIPPSGDVRAVKSLATRPSTAFPIDLGNLGGGYTQPTAINASSQVVGMGDTANGEWHAFMWSADRGIVDLGSPGYVSRAEALNNSGQVVGYYSRAEDYPQGTHAFSWTKESGMVDLLSLGGAASVAAAVNAGGEVVGRSMTADGVWHAVLWTEDGTIDLNPPGSTSSSAVSLNESGQVLVTTGRAGRTFLWTAAGGFIKLGDLGGDRTGAGGMNARGQVVGSSLTADGVWHAVLWTKDGAPIDLNPPGSTSSTAVALNDRAQVVISAQVSNEFRAFSWTQEGGLVDLGSYGWQTNPSDVNAQGLVVGISFVGAGTNAATAFAWNKRNGIVDLGSSDGLFVQTSAEGVNDSGQAIGMGDGHALLWDLRPTTVTSDSNQ